MAKEPVRSSLSWLFSRYGTFYGRITIQALRANFVSSLKSRGNFPRALTGHNTWRKATYVCKEGIDTLCNIFAKQCNVIAAQRIKRSAQIINLYSRLYDKETARYMVSKFGHNFIKNYKGRPLNFLVGALLFSWEKERIRDDDIQRCLEDATYTEVLPEVSDSATFVQNCSYNANNIEGWHIVCEKENFKLWRKPIEDTTFYEYRVHGTFFDIPARAFFAVQVDLEYRKQWDKLIIALDVVDRDRQSGSEVVRWIMQYPFPMYSREYVYKRRYKIDHENKIMVVVSRSVDHPDIPADNKYVRIKNYQSELVIKPHNNFDDNGFDYVLTYFDDPQAVIPSAAYNWMASSGVPDFVEKLHQAAKQLMDKSSKRPRAYNGESWLESQREKVAM